MKPLALLACVVVLGIVAHAYTWHSDPSQMFDVVLVTQLTPWPGVTSTASGLAVFNVNRAAHTLTYRIIHNVNAAQSIKAHMAPPGQTGPHLGDICGDGSDPCTERGVERGSDEIGEEEWAYLRDGKVYITIQSDAYPDGEIVGWLEHPFIEGSAWTHYAIFQGCSEVPLPETPDMGAFGLGLMHVTGVDWETEMVTMRALVHHNIEPIADPEPVDPVAFTGGTINGPALVGQNAPAWTTLSSTTSRRVLEAEFTLDLKYFVNDLFYSNLATESNPAGEIRGQWHMLALIIRKQASGGNGVVIQGSEERLVQVIGQAEFSTRILTLYAQYDTRLTLASASLVNLWDDVVVPLDISENPIRAWLRPSEEHPCFWFGDGDSYGCAVQFEFSSGEHLTIPLSAPGEEGGLGAVLDTCSTVPLITEEVIPDAKYSGVMLSQAVESDVPGEEYAIEAAILYDVPNPLGVALHLAPLGDAGPPVTSFGTSPFIRVPISSQTVDALKANLGYISITDADREVLRGQLFRGKNCFRDPLVCLNGFRSTDFCACDCLPDWEGWDCSIPSTPCSCTRPVCKEENYVKELINGHEILFCEFASDLGTRKRAASPIRSLLYAELARRGQEYASSLVKPAMRR